MENEDGTGKMFTEGFVREAKEITVKIMIIAATAILVVGIHFTTEWFYASASPSQISFFEQIHRWLSTPLLIIAAIWIVWQTQRIRIIKNRKGSPL